MIIKGCLCWIYTHLTLTLLFKYQLKKGSKILNITVLFNGIFLILFHNYVFNNYNYKENDMFYIKQLIYNKLKSNRLLL